MNMPFEPERPSEQAVEPPASGASPAPVLPSHAPAFTPKLVVGIAIIVAGLLMTLDNIMPSHEIARIAFKFWPLILVAMGLAKLRSEGDRGVLPWLLIGGGIFGLLVTFGVRNFEDFIGPAILLAVGIFIVTKALQQHRGAPSELKSNSAFQSGSAIFSGWKRRPVGLFKGAEVTVIFGGFELDLLQAHLDGDSARVDLFVLFGGGEIRVPEGWEVQTPLTSIAGGVGDKTRPPSASGPRPRLVLTGLVLFGGVEIRH
jgi:Domain of unknown function (DUF5668)